MYYELTLNIFSFLYGYVCGRLGAVVARERPEPSQTSQLRRDDERRRTEYNSCTTGNLTPIEFIVYI